MHEFAVIERFARHLPRPSIQRNGVNESDAELLELPDGHLLAATVDDLVEEIRLGLYPDPETIGWVALTASLSDLAAVGARPLGALVTLGAPPDLEPEWLDRLAAGVRDAADATGVGIAGGDTNTTPEFRIGCTALGLVDARRVLTRRGTRAGDLVFASAPLGTGSAWAFSSLVGTPLGQFRPTPRLDVGSAIGGIASACVDSSDGGLDALYRLAVVNGVDFDIDPRDPGDSFGDLPDTGVIRHATKGPLDPDAAHLLAACGLPGWLLLAGLHGEFELVFTVPPSRCAELLAALASVNVHPVLLGAAVPPRTFPHGKHEPTVRILDGDDRLDLDPVKIRAAFDGFDGDLNKTLGLLFDEVTS